MSAPAILERLRAAGVAFRVVGDRLHYRGPRQALTEPVLAELRACKPALLQALRPLADRPAPPICIERLLYAGPAVQVLAVEGGNGTTYEKRARVGKHVEFVLDHSDDARDAREWIEHVRRIAQSVRGTP